MKEILCVLPTEVVGLPVVDGLHRTFGEESNIRIMKLTDQVVTVYNNEKTEGMFQDILQQMEEMGDLSDCLIFFICAGSIVTSVLSGARLKELYPDSYLLAYSKYKKEYIAFDWSGRSIDLKSLLSLYLGGGGE